MMKKYSTVTIRETQELKKVQISSDLKPKIYKNIEEKWQSIINTAARIVGVPSGLIMQLNEETIEVFLTSNTEGNPYEKGEEAKLIYGLYCETVIGTQDKLLVPNARKNKVWKKNNPDVNINMISYLGFPINWPDGEIFGTVCVLDSKENHYNSDYEDLLRQIKYHIEDDLELLLLNKDLNIKNTQLEQLNNTKSRFLSLISHDIRGNIGLINNFLQLITSDFDNFDKNELKNSLVSLNQISCASFQALENLLRWTKSDLVELKPEIVTVNIIEIVEEILSFFNHVLILKAIKVNKFFYSSEVIVKTDKNMITVILRNIISNAIKYNKRDGELTIQVVLENNKPKIIIKDTGIGMTEAVIDKLFNYNNKHTLGTEGESSAGIGLLLTQEFLDKLGIKVSVKSELDKGTSFKIVL